MPTIRTQEPASSTRLSLDWSSYYRVSNFDLERRWFLEVKTSQYSLVGRKYPTRKIEAGKQHS